MLEAISKGISNIFNSLMGKKVITESNIKEAIDELRNVLVEADVNLYVVDEFLRKVKEEALGEKVIKSLTVREKFISIVYEQLKKFLGDDYKELKLKSPQEVSVILLAGLQGSGKTTIAAKLANFYKEQRKPLLVACDIYRPAAIEQLKILGQSINIETYSQKNMSPENIAKSAIKYAIKNGYNLLIIDTAGRLQIDKEMMDELKRIEKEVKPDETILVVDSMTGQVAADVAKEFKKYVKITKLILTKFDSDTRGGAALSAKMIADVPIVFVGVGEKVTDLEKFYPDRISQRIIGMGDILTLVEKAEKAYTEEQAKKLEKKIKKNEFDFGDMLEQIEGMTKMGPIDNIISMIPGAANVDKNLLDKQTQKLLRYKYIIQSMTKKERENPLLVMNNPSRKRRISKGAGVKLFDIEQLIKDFNNLKKVMGKMSKKNIDEIMKNFGN